MENLLFLGVPILKHFTVLFDVANILSFQDNSQNAPLVGSTLETLLRFLNWIPLGYIFETKLITTLIYKVGLYLE